MWLTPAQYCCDSQDVGSGPLVKSGSWQTIMPAHKWVLAHPFHSRAEKAAPPLSTQLQFLQLPEGKYCLSLNKPTISFSLSPSLSHTHIHTLQQESKALRDVTSALLQVNRHSWLCARPVTSFLSLILLGEGRRCICNPDVCLCVREHAALGSFVLFFLLLGLYLLHVDFTM